MKQLVGKNIARYRKERQLTQQELANILRNTEYGEKQNDTHSDLRR